MPTVRYTGIICDRSGAQDFHCQSAGGIISCIKRAWLSNATGYNREWMRSERLLQAVYEGGAIAEVDAIRKPDEFALWIGRQQA